MANLTQKTMLLLDKLYNLKSTDNIIIKEITSKIEEINSTISATNQRKIALESEAETNEKDLLVFTTQQEAFLTAFSDINNETFGELRKIGVNVDINSMVEKVKENSPGYIADIQERTRRIKEEIEAGENQNRELETELSDYNDKKAKAENDRTALISLMEQSLSSDEIERESLTTKYTKDILHRFGVFEDDEISTISKLILFPEDGLIDYDREYPERLASGKVGEAETVIPEEQPIEPAEETTFEVVEETAIPVEEVKEEPKEEAKSSLEVYERRDEDPTSIIDLSPLNNPEAPVVEEKIEDYLISLGMNMATFNEETKDLNPLMTELSYADRDLIAKNYELLKSVDATLAAYRYREGHSYLIDKELSQKITILRAKGITEKNIKILLEDSLSGLRLDLVTFEARINAAEELGTPISNENLDLLRQDLVKYSKNLRLLSENEISLDDKEKRNYQYILNESDYVGSDLEILKNYLININRSNDKYALNVFAKHPYDLVTDVDNIIENNLETVLTSNPEVLTERNGAFVDRVKYFASTGREVIDSTGKGTFAPYVLNIFEAIKETDSDLNIPVSLTEDEVNPLIPSIIGNENTVSSLVEILNEYYHGRTDFKDIELSPVATENFSRLAEMFEQKFHAERIGKYTFQVAGGFISKLKLERHLKTIITKLEQNGESIDGIENEILLTSMLYNLRQDEQTLRKMVETCLGFNVENTLGGKTL